MKKFRSWCGIACYPGLSRFFVGNIVMPVQSNYAEIENALIEHALTFLPTGFELIELKCGSIILYEDEDTEE